MDGFPGQREGGAERFEASFELVMKQGMFKDGLAEGDAIFGVGKSVGHGALRECDADYTVCNAGDIQNFEDEIDAGVSGTEEVGFAVAQLDFAGGDGTGGDLVFEAADEVVEIAIFVVTRDEEEGQATNACGGAFGARGDYR